MPWQPRTRIQWAKVQVVTADLYRNHAVLKYSPHVQWAGLLVCGLLAEQREAYEIFDLGDFALQGGRTIRNAKLAYK